jgi:hypothetical protein
MLGFLIVILFTIAAAVAVAVLTGSTINGARAYRELSARSGERYNSIIFTIEQFELLQAEPVFRMRQVTRAAVLRPMVHRKATALPVAA